jgi:hypothetical protein
VSSSPTSVMDSLDAAARQQEDNEAVLWSKLKKAAKDDTTAPVNGQDLGLAP